MSRLDITFHLPHPRHTSFAEQGFHEMAYLVLEIVGGELVEVVHTRILEILSLDLLKLLLVALTLQYRKQLEVLTLKERIHLLTPAFLKLLYQPLVMGDILISLNLVALTSDPARRRETVYPIFRGIHLTLPIS